MSSQYEDGWFPECYSCGSGNLGNEIICAYCAHKNVPLPDTLVGTPAMDEDLIEKDGHFWLPCMACKSLIVSDSGLFGHYVICWECYREQKGLGDSTLTRINKAQWRNEMKIDLRDGAVRITNE